MEDITEEEFDIYEKYFDNNMQGKLVLTHEKLEYIRRNHLNLREKFRRELKRRCKYCGKKLTNEDYVGDWYGICEGECDN